MQNHCGQSKVAREGLDLELERSSDSLILLPRTSESRWYSS